MGNFFMNFIDQKLVIDSPNAINLIILLVFLLLILLTLKRNEELSTKLFNFNQTEQMKGVAIFFVILGHLWVHVANEKPMLVFSGDAVSMFLILSGFGLTLSCRRTKIDLKTFVAKRLNRVMIPYWLATIVIILLNYAILSELLDTRSIIITLFGLNLSVKLRHLDYVRWFVTFILLWYIVFYLVNVYLNKNRRTIVFLMFSLILLPISYYVLHFGWYQFFSFPAGCIIAIYYDEFLILWNKHKNIILLCSAIGLVYVVLYKIAMSNADIYNYVINTIPNIFLTYIGDANSLVLSLCVFFFMGYIFGKGYESKLLIFLGQHSYELFLLHGVFLVKYNPFIRWNSLFYMVSSFYIYLAFVISLSFGLSKISKWVYAIQIS